MLDIDLKFQIKYFIWNMKIRLFESIYLDELRFREEVLRLGKKYKIRFEDEGGKLYKVLFFPYRLIKYYSGNRERRMLVDIASINNLSDPLHTVFTIRNDYLKIKKTYIEISDQEYIIPDPPISNRYVVNGFKDVLNKLNTRLTKLEKYPYLYAEKLAKFNLNRLFFGSLQREDEMAFLEEKTKEKSTLSFLKSILEGGLGLDEKVYVASNMKDITYMPILFLKSDEKLLIYNIYRKFKENRSKLYLYVNDELYREWIDRFLYK